MLEVIVYLVLGLIGLWFGADFLVKGVKNIAEYFGVSPFFIGLAFVSIGTSIPEIAVSAAGGLQRLQGIETSGIVIGNALGSAISQIGLFIGIASLIIPLTLSRSKVLRQGSFLIAAVLIVFGILYDGTITKFEGWIAIAAYALYYLFIWFSVKHHRVKKKRKENPLPNIVYIILGIALVIFTSKIVVENGITLAEDLGVAQSIIGIFLIGLGGGLPELSVAIASARRKAIGVAIGDLMGSNICDLLLGLGIGSAISGFVVEPRFVSFDIPILLFLSVVVISFLHSEKGISKAEGLILMGLFLAYAALRIFAL